MRWWCSELSLSGVVLLGPSLFFAFLAFSRFQIMNAVSLGSASRNDFKLT